MLKKFTSADILVSSAHSPNGVCIALFEKTMWVCCPSCLIVLGWTYTDPSGEGGHWSCLNGCRTVYRNLAGVRTASVYEDIARRQQYQQTLEQWVANWLGVPVDDINVTVEMS
jgi:hypothetical protein